MSHRRLTSPVLLMILAIFSSGCASDEFPDTGYGRSRGKSWNGTNAFAEILRSRGHEVRAAFRANEAMADWADIIVRFAPQPGPIDRREGDWLTSWLNARPLRKLVYIPRDYDAEVDLWDAQLAIQPTGTDPKIISQIESRQRLAAAWPSKLPQRTTSPAEVANWFEFEPTPLHATRTKTLHGPWSEDVDAGAAAISRHEVFKAVGGEEILLEGDGSPLVIGWSYANQSKVLGIANGSFLLNGSLLNKARRPLTMRASDWIGSRPLHVAFLEGRRIDVGPQDDDSQNQTSQFHLLTVAPFGWIAGQLVVFLSLFAFSFAVRLGRPTPEPPSGVERPSAHPEALGALFARTRRAETARFLLESYRRWRSPSSIAGRMAPSTPPTSR